MPRILIVDDDGMITKVMSHYFKDMGYDTDVVSSGEDALAYLKIKSTDYLITDLRLPGMTGFDMLTKALKDNPLIKCLIMSGALDYDLPPSVAALGITAKNLIQKPEKLSVILQTLMEL